MALETLKKGDTLRCDECGMELTVDKDCQSDKGGPTLECCGQELTKA